MQRLANPAHCDPALYATCNPTPNNMKTTMTTALAALALSGFLVLPGYSQNTNPGTARPPGQQQPGGPVPNPKNAAPPAPATPGTAAPVAPAPADEADFVKTAAKSGMGEVKMATLGTEKASDKKVKELAQMLVKDHSAANKNLKSIAEELKLTLDADDPAAQEKYDSLKAMSGKEFDTAFLDHMAMGHQKSIALYEAAKKVAKSKSVSSYIDKTLPVIKGHAAKIAKLQGGATKDTTRKTTEPPPATGAPKPKE